MSTEPAAIPVNKAEADDFRRQVEETLARVRSPASGSAAPPVARSSASTSDVAGRLRRLDDLHAQGVLTAEEHATKRAAILEEL